MDQPFVFGIIESSIIYPGSILSPYFRIARYATVKTDESVLIIGGYTADGSPDRTTIIAEYRNDVWSNIGNFVQLRDTHGAVILGSTIMIVGGWPKSGSS